MIPGTGCLLTLSLNWFLVSALHSRMPSRIALTCVVTTGTGSRMATTCTIPSADNIGRGCQWRSGGGGARCMSIFHSSMSMPPYSTRLEHTLSPHETHTMYQETDCHKRCTHQACIKRAREGSILQGQGQFLQELPYCETPLCQLPSCPPANTLICVHVD